jgi:putative transposase
MPIIYLSPTICINPTVKEGFCNYLGETVWMKVNKTFKYRLYPTKEQEVLLARHFGSKRFIFNYFLCQRKKAYLEAQKTLNYYGNAKSLTEMKHSEEFSWMGEINSQSLQASLRDLDTAYNRFFAKQGMFPKFKSRHDRQSFRIPQNVFYKDGLLDIPKFKKPIKVQEDRPPNGKILFATVSKTPTGRYFVAITCETEHEQFPKVNKNVGVDVGLKELAVLSDGKRYANIKSTIKHQRRLAYEQRQLSKKVKGSASRGRQRIKVAKVHEKIVNSRNDHIHKITTAIVRENQTICVEDLSVANMMKNHCLAKGIADVAWGEFFRQLRYKSEWNGRNLVEIGRFFPSSKTCWHCKFIHQGLTLKDRTWVCPRCGTELDRELNASRNILEQGLNDFNSGCGTQSEPKQKRGEASPGNGESVNPETQPSLVVG